MRPARVHNLRGNKAERSPHRLFVWDTETRPHHEPKRELHRLRFWAAEVVQRHDRRPKEPARQAGAGTQAEGLVDYLEGACRSSETTWAFAHNQSFDLAVTSLPLQLLDRGWSVTAHALTSPSPWARLIKGSRRLVLADSTSWLPGPLAGIGAQVGIDKPALPDFEDPDQEWAWRCRQDVRILAQALIELMDWWDHRHLGSWSITGPQSGFNLMRHLPSPHTVVIDPDPTGRGIERQAIKGGRREVWRVGRQTWGDYREIDFKLAHATIAAHCPLPKRRSFAFQRLDLGDWRLTSERWAPLAWCHIDARAPRYPLEVEGRLFYPTGHFRTLLAGPEIAEASRRGELLEVGPGYIYQLGQHMGGWGRWVLQQLGEPDPETPEVARTAIRAWSRQVPGKWAGRTGRVIHEGPSLEMAWNLEHGRHHPSGAPVAVLDMALSRQVVLQDQDSDDCFPAVLAWIQSEVRVRLGRLVDQVGPGRMLTCNTDGLLCEWGTGFTEGFDPSTYWPLTPRQKARHAWVDVISPQHVILPTERRLSGVPASADEVAPHAYQWMTWPRLPSQIASGVKGAYVRELRTADLSKVPVNRWVSRGGTCWPVQAEVGEDGETRLLPPWHDWPGMADTGLRSAQHPVLAALLEPAADAGGPGA